MNRLAVISDIHSNLQALEAVWDRIDELGIDTIFCLGDIVGYGAKPVECLTRIREAGVRCVQGNHDALVADGSQNLDFNIYSLAAVEHNRPLLSQDDIQWLGNLPTHPVVFDGQGFVPVRQKQIHLEDTLRVLTNPGSVGQPRDNDPRASFSWWDRDENVLTFERVEYDILAARHDIIEAGLPRVLGDRLLEGR